MVKFNFDVNKSFDELVNIAFSGKMAYLNDVNTYTLITAKRAGTTTQASYSYSPTAKSGAKYRYIAADLEKTIFFTYNDLDTYNKVMYAAKQTALHEGTNDRHIFALVSSKDFENIQKAFINDKLNSTDGFAAWKTIHDARVAAAKEGKTPHSAGPRSKIDWSKAIAFRNLDGEEFTYDAVRKNHKKVIYVIKDFENEKGYYFDYTTKKLRCGETWVSTEQKNFLGADLSNVFYISTKAFMHFVANKKEAENFEPFTVAAGKAESAFFESFKGQTFVYNDLSSYDVSRVKNSGKLEGTKLMELIDTYSKSDDSPIAKYHSILASKGIITEKYLSDIIDEAYPMLAYVSVSQYRNDEVVAYIKSIEA